VDKTKQNFKDGATEMFSGACYGAMLHSMRTKKLQWPLSLRDALRVTQIHNDRVDVSTFHFHREKTHRHSDGR